MSSDSNRLFHYLGFRDLIWIPESDLKNYHTIHNVPYEAGERFLTQHAINGCWSVGIYYPTPYHNSVLRIRWLRVIVIKELVQ